MVPKVLTAKKETTYAVDAAPTMAANAALTRNFATTPIQVDRNERNRDRPVRGRSADKPSNPRQAISYELEIAGSGVAGTAPAWMEHLEACGLAAPVLTANTSAEQRFVASAASLSAMTVHHWSGSQRRRATGVRGSFGWDFTAGRDPVWQLQLVGLLHPTAPVDESAPGTPDLSRWRDPLEVNDLNTDFLLDGHALHLQSFTGSSGANADVRNLVNARYVRLGEQAITGRIVGRCPSIADKNHFATLLSGAEVPVALTQGTAGGNIVELRSQRLQVTGIDLSEDGDELMVTIAYALNVGTTPDDLIITAK